MLDKEEQERLGNIVTLMKEKGIDRDCIIWTCVSAFDGGKLEEFFHFVENNPISDDILYAWDEKNIPRKRDLYVYEDGVEYEFVDEDED